MPKTITVKKFAPVAVAVPGVLKVKQGDVIEIRNETGESIRVFTAGDEVLSVNKDGQQTKLQRLEQHTISGISSDNFTVEKDDGTHELAVHYSYDDPEKKRKRTGFALGASSPKIVVVRPPTGSG